MIRPVSDIDIDDLIYQAKKSPRKRMISRLHEHKEAVQRMINAMLPGTYVAPHKHEDPDKVELFCILRGRVAILEFSDGGAIQNVVTLNTSGPVRIVEIPPRTYHTMIVLEPSALLEIIEGPYDPDTHKKFASWAPLEDNPKANDYLMYLSSVIHNWKT